MCRILNCHHEFYVCYFDRVYRNPEEQSPSPSRPQTEGSKHTYITIALNQQICFTAKKEEELKSRRKS